MHLFLDLKDRIFVMYFVLHLIIDCIFHNVICFICISCSLSELVVHFKINSIKAVNREGHISIQVRMYDIVYRSISSKRFSVLQFIGLDGLRLPGTSSLKVFNLKFTQLQTVFIYDNANVLKKANTYSNIILQTITAQ